MDPKQLLKQLNLKQKCTLVCGADFWHSACIEELDIPALTFSDGPHGLRYQADNADHLGLHHSAKATCFPTASALANSWDPELTKQVGKALGIEAAALDVDVLLGPGINIIRNPKGGRNFEYYSEDPYLTGKLAAGMVQGIQKHVSACPKHFLLNSQETSRMSIDETADAQTLHELYLPAFQRVIQEASPDWIMSSYNKIDGEYASESKQVYELLKQLDFDGAVVTDWGGGCEIAKAIEAGSSLEMPGTFGQSARELYTAILRNEVSPKALDKRVLEVLTAIQKAQDKKVRNKKAQNTTVQNKKAYQNEDVQRHQDHLNDQDSHTRGTQEELKTGLHLSRNHHHILAMEAAVQSSVLLQNNGILPLKPHTKVAWIGPFEDFPIQGGGSSQVEPSAAASFEELLKKSTLENAGIEQGYSLKTDKPIPKLEKKAFKAAKQADVIVFLSALPLQEQLEGLDRQAEAIPKNQVTLYQKLMELDKPVILVDAIAGPIEIPDAQRFAAILYLGLAGQGAPAALVRMLAGNQSPAGFLAQTFANKWSDHPSSKVFPALDGISTRPEGMHVGYRAFLHQDVLFPFGYGLSYTSFSARHPVLNLKKQRIRTDICNTGEYTGSCLLQIYVIKPERDYKELVGFQKVSLTPDSCQEVIIDIDPAAWQMYDPKKQNWIHPDGLFQLELAYNVKTTIKSWEILQKDGLLSRYHPHHNTDIDAIPAQTIRSETIIRSDHPNDPEAIEIESGLIQAQPENLEPEPDLNWDDCVLNEASPIWSMALDEEVMLEEPLQETSLTDRMDLAEQDDHSSLSDHASQNTLFEKASDRREVAEDAGKEEGSKEAEKETALEADREKTQKSVEAETLNTADKAALKTEKETVQITEGEKASEEEQPLEESEKEKALEDGQTLREYEEETVLKADQSGQEPGEEKVLEEERTVQKEEGRAPDSEPEADYQQTHPQDAKSLPLGLDAPLHAFCEAKDPMIAALAKGVRRIRNRSLEKKKPSMVAISLNDMPLKGLTKVSAEYFNRNLVEAFAKQANSPTLAHAGTLMKEAFKQAGSILSGFVKKKK